MKLAAPEYLHLLWGLIPLIGCLVWAYQRRKKALFALVEKKLLSQMLESANPKAPAWKGIFFVAGVLLAILALCRPQWGFQWEEMRRRGNDVFIAIDTSKSMLAEDVKPNRLEKAKLEIRELLTQLKGDRVGLIAFAGTAFVQCPLTVDAAALRLFLDSIDPSLVPQGGTAIGEAIRKAMRSFPGQEKKHKVLILLTDGEDLEGGAEAAAAQARSEGVALYVVGLGTSEGAPIPITDETGARTFLKDKQGQTVLTRLDLSTLGKMNPAGVASSLSEVYEKYIVPMEKKELESVRQKRFEEKFQWPLFFSLLFFLGEILIPERKRKEGGLFKRKIISVVGSVSFILLFCITSASGGTGREVREGNRLYDEEKWQEAASRYTAAQLKKPAAPEIYFNLGNALYKQGKFKEARQLYEQALSREQKNSAFTEKIIYNMGNCDYRLKQLEQALARYGKAMELDTKDEDARYNYEFVKKKLEEQKQQAQAQKEKGEEGQKEEGQKEQAQEKEGKEEQKEGLKAEEQKREEKKEEQKEAQKQPGEMTKEEAEALLNTVKEEELSGKELKLQQRRGTVAEPEKDW